jgi:ribosomal protein L29
MKRKEFNDLRAKTVQDLKKIAIEKKSEAEKARMKIVGGKEKNLKTHKNLAREVAKILSLIREKEIIESLNKEKQKIKEVKEKKEEAK